MQSINQSKLVFLSCLSYSNILTKQNEEIDCMPLYCLQKSNQNRIESDLELDVQLITMSRSVKVDGTTYKKIQTLNRYHT